MFQGIDIFLTSADRMSVMMTKGEGVTVITLNSDPSSSCPPICQILKGLCYSPALCSVSQPLKKKASLSILGFIAFGFMCILSERFPSRCLVVLNVIVSVAGVAFSITAIVLYSIYIANMEPWGCDYGYYGYPTPATVTRTPLQEKCNEIQQLTLVLLRGLNGVLIVLSVLELCVVISAAILGIKALRSNRQNKVSAPLQI
uniref:Uncharacterized protein n=1 Tax=Oryzias sinensis TaxID=183150 RepID=A0A8C7X0C0_9TELE